MKKVLNIVFVSLIILGCSVNQKEVIILNTLDQFSTQQENEQLGIDLLNYKYQTFFQSEFLDLSMEVFENINWQYFITKDKKEVSFRLTLTDEAIKHKDKIVNYFQRTVDLQIEKQVHNKDKFERAIELSLENIKNLDNGNYDSFWDNTSNILKSRTTKSGFSKLIKTREGISKKGGKRSFFSKQYYNSLPGVKEKGFYVVIFTFEKDKNMIEQLTFYNQNDSLKITGYDYRMPN